MKMKYTRVNLKKLETTLLKGLNEDETQVKKLATTVYPAYRNILHKLNGGERGDIYERYHGYCEQSISPVKLLPIVPNAIRGLLFNPRPVRGR